MTILTIGLENAEDCLRVALACSAGWAKTTLRHWQNEDGAEDQSRTDDTRIFSLGPIMLKGHLTFKLDITRQTVAPHFVHEIPNGVNQLHLVG